MFGSSWARRTPRYQAVSPLMYSTLRRIDGGLPRLPYQRRVPCIPFSPSCRVGSLVPEIACQAASVIVPLLYSRLCCLGPHIRPDSQRHKGWRKGHKYASTPTHTSQRYRQEGHRQVINEQSHVLAGTAVVRISTPYIPVAGLAQNPMVKMRVRQNVMSQLSATQFGNPWKHQ